jgi:hypothetical protein
MELAAETGIPAAAAPVRAIKRTQDTLGRLHDLQVLQGYVSAAQAEPASRKPPDGGLEIIARQLEDECRHLHARYLSGVPALHRVIEITRTTVVPQLAHARRPRPSLKMGLESPARSKNAIRPMPAAGLGK